MAASYKGGVGGVCGRMKGECFSVKRKGFCFAAWGAIFLASVKLFAAEPVVDCVEVKTQASENKFVKVWYRVPSSYDSRKKRLSRVLVLFGGRNCDGKIEVSGKLGWTEWADLNGIFLVAPTLKNDNYWEPKQWSGRALLDALAMIAEKYRISTSGLLYYGYSAGSQASNLFPAWRPDLCRAYVSHACGVFHQPKSVMKEVSGLVTCGDADTARYVISRRFVDAYRKLGISIIWKSFPNHPHDVPPGSVRLAQEFLAHNHWSYLEDLGRQALSKCGATTFVGDDADGVFYEAGTPAASEIVEEDRIVLPSLSVANAWGRPGNVRKMRQNKSMILTNIIDGVQVVLAIPVGLRSDSRILILLGGRNWSGERTIRELGFYDWATERNWCVIAPSFSHDEYWNPDSGSGKILQSAIDILCRKYAVRQLPVFVFGYSAGGQLASLLLNTDYIDIGAWSIFACGVYPRETRIHVPGIISCGIEDEDRFRISRDFVYRYRENGGLLVWKPLAAGHGLSAVPLELSRLFFDAVAENRPCALWGEDDVMQLLPKDRIDVEFRNPLYNRVIAERWKK